MAVILPDSFELALARISIRAGFARDGRGWMLTRQVVPGPPPGETPSVNYWIEMLTATLGQPWRSASGCNAKPPRIARPLSIRPLTRIE